MSVWLLSIFGHVIFVRIKHKIIKKCYKSIIFCRIELKVSKWTYFDIFQSMYVDLVLEVYDE